MIKKILFVLAYPFILVYLIASFPFKIVWIILKDKQNRPSKKKKKNHADINFLYVGELIFADCKDEFHEFFNLYLSNKKNFQLKYKLDLQGNTNLKPIEILQAFGDFKQKLGLIDWRGEENINEIDKFIENQISKNLVWTDTVSLRASVDVSKQRDGQFIIKLFKSIDKDLQSIGYRLLFFDMEWDAYVFIPTSTEVFDKILEYAPSRFQSVDELY